MKEKKKTAIIITVIALVACVCGGSVFAYNVKEDKETAKSLADIATVIETGQISELTKTELVKFEQARSDVEKKLEVEKKAAEAKKKAEAEAAKKKAAKEAAAKEAARKQAIASAKQGSSNSGSSSRSTTSGKQYSSKKSSSASSSKASGSKKSTKTKQGSSALDDLKPGYYPTKNEKYEGYIDGDSGNTAYSGEW